MAGHAKRAHVMLLPSGSLPRLFAHLCSRLTCPRRVANTSQVSGPFLSPSKLQAYASFTTAAHAASLLTAHQEWLRLAGRALHKMVLCEQASISTLLSLVERRLASLYFLDRRQIVALGNPRTTVPRKRSPRTSSYESISAATKYILTDLTCRRRVGSLRL